MLASLIRAAAACLCLGLLCGCAASRGGPPTQTASCLLDLSHSYDESTLYWPTSPSSFQKETLSYGHTPAGYFYSAFSISTPEHGGTHIDAPIHFAQDGRTTDQIPLERLIAPGIVIDMSAAAAANPDALLSEADVVSFEREQGPIAPGTIVLIRTGWAERWPDRKRYLGDDEPGNASDLHFPGISKEAAELLVEREVAAVGIDTASIDHGPSTGFDAHRALMEAGVPAFENVASLDFVPSRGARIIALPMKIGGGSGGPLRIVAMVPAAQCPKP